MINATFPKDELEREKGVVIQELKMYEDNPMAMVMQKWQSFYYGDNSYGWPIIGTIDNINSFSSEKLFEHKADLYTKDNLLISIAGKIENEETIYEQIGTLFKDLPSQKRISKPVFPSYTPDEKVGSFEQKNEQTHLVISCPGFDGNSEKKYAANVLATLLGGNMSSRLFQRIREKEGLCYYIKGMHGANQDSGVFLIRAGIDKARFDYGVKRIFEELNNIASGDLSQEEFDNAIGYTKGQIQMGIESSDEMASFLGSQELLYGKIETLEEVVKKYEKLTLADIQELAGMLSEDKCYLFYIK
jgi:predicted Zn-dependent peptidase